MDAAEDPADDDLAAIAGLLADDTARAILAETAREPRSAAELAEACGVTKPTIYRKLEPLREHDLVDERTRPDAEGHHHQVYAATLDRLVVDVTAEGIASRVDRREGMADRFTRFIEELR